MRLTSIILEGGNVFKDEDNNDLTRRINKKEVLPTIRWLQLWTKLPLTDNILGSAGKADDSGDLDIGVDENQISKQELVDKLVAWCQKQGIADDKIFNRAKSKSNPKFDSGWIKVGGDVHFRTPIIGDPQNGFVQTDFMLRPDLKWAKWLADYDPQSRYKNADRIILLNSIAKSKGYIFNDRKGLSYRDTGQFITKDPKKFTAAILGSGADTGDIKSVESILSFIKDNDVRWRDRVADAEQNFVERGRDTTLFSEDK